VFGDGGRGIVSALSYLHPTTQRVPDSPFKGEGRKQWVVSALFHGWGVQAFANGRSCFRKRLSACWLLSAARSALFPHFFTFAATGQRTLGSPHREEGRSGASCFHTFLVRLDPRAMRGACGAGPRPSPGALRTRLSPEFTPSCHRAVPEREGGGPGSRDRRRRPPRPGRPPVLQTRRHSSSFLHRISRAAQQASQGCYRSGRITGTAPPGSTLTGAVSRSAICRRILYSHTKRRPSARVISR
jgi:hypothetical protein